MMDTVSREAISRLPDEVLGKILSFLPTKQAASTSILSKEWRYLFRLVDNLDFDDKDKKSRSMFSFLADLLEIDLDDKESSYVFPESFKNFVDRTLSLQCGYPIKRLSLKIKAAKNNDCNKTCVGRWISNVVERGVLELDLMIKLPRFQCLFSLGKSPSVHGFLPPKLFASKSLTKLSLGKHLYLEKLPSCVSLPSLKSLFLDMVFFECGEEGLSCVLLAGCPALEELSLRYSNFSEMPNNITSPSLKRLSVDYGSPICFDDKSHVLSFDLPNLAYLDYTGFALGDYPIVTLDSLVEAKLDLQMTNMVIYPFVKLLPLFDNLVNLSLGSKNRKCWKLLVYLLKHSPKLETLVIEDLDGYTSVICMPLNNVKVLSVLGYRGTAQEFKQLKSFLWNFECLELLQVDVTEDDDGMLLKATEDLERLCGASVSSKCHIKATRTRL
ncbi:unnamed protein product [Microthlaspi erraticum]|uniref:F-box domain-containing protein n=1 Tax=Microthlaspi erraticum TaxID=1685480 RepID=A0A6D2IH88_9BRAS|nr:unnamed protein product [Microthlaspi erraticum]